MATYTIVSKDKDPLGTNEIHADDTIIVSDGDVFVVDPSADSNITFQAGGGGSASFDIQITGTNSNGIDIKVESNLTPNISIADGVDLSDTDLDLKATDAATLTVGDNVSLGRYEGSTDGPNTITIGDGFTTESDWKFGDATDSLTVGNDATFKQLDAGAGDDTVIVGDGATIHDFDMKSGNDSVTFGEDLNGNKLKTSDGDDTITIGDNGQVEVDGGSGNDTLYTDSPGANERNIETAQAYCYTPGTLIDTPDGPRPVESLKPGDLITTLDHGPKAIRWTRSGDQPLEDAEDEAKPVLIKAGALGQNRPAQDLIVSPQHRVFVGGAGQLQAVFWSEAFAPAKALTGLPGIRHMKGKSQITWVHFACDRHEVVTANGCVSESLLLGPMVVNGLTDAERRELIAIYGAAPTPDAALNGPAARECLNVGDVRRHLAKCKTDAPYATANDVSKWDVDLAMEHWEADALDEAVLDETYTLVCHRRCDYPADADMQSYRRN